MEISLIHDHYNDDHLAEVMAEMTTLGAPTIRAIWMACYDMWAALEGCHRIRAAEKLGLVPVIDPIDYDDVCDMDCTDGALGLDLDNPGTPVADLVDDCYRRTVIAFENE
jgi:hypothetical protein